jgi:D-xylose transport system substrate-binding protein
MKNLVFIFAICLMLFSVIPSCKEEGKIKIGFLEPQLKTDRYIKETEYFTKKIEELGGECIVASADLDDQLQIRQAKEMISKGVKVLVICAVNLNTAPEIVRAAHKAKIKVIANDRLIRNCDLDYFITFDSEKVGELMADYATKIKADGNYILLGGDKADLNASLVKAGQLKIINPLINAGKIKIIYNTFVESWSGDNAKEEIRRVLKFSSDKPDVILASNDAMANGVIDLLKEYNMQGKVLITGQDALLPSCRNIVSGYQMMTIYKSVKTLATKAAEISIKISRNDIVSDFNTTVSNGKKEVPALLLEPIVVDRNNIKAVVVGDGFLSEKDIYQN